MNINSPTAIPSSLHEEMKEKQCTFWYLFLLKHAAGILVWETGHWLRGEQYPGAPYCLFYQLGRNVQDRVDWELISCLFLFTPQLEVQSLGPEGSEEDRRKRWARHLR